MEKLSQMDVCLVHMIALLPPERDNDGPLQTMQTPEISSALLHNQKISALPQLRRGPLLKQQLN